MTDHDPDPLWLRVHEALDRGADPLVDPELSAAFADDPARLQEYARLVEALRALPLARAPRPRLWRRPAFPWLAAAAALLVALGLWGARSAPLPAGEPCRLVHLRCTVTSPAGERTFEWRPLHEESVR